MNIKAKKNGLVGKRKAKGQAPDGYRPVTTAFTLPGEQAMLEGVIADMKRGGIDFTLVEKKNGVEVWRRPPHRFSKPA